MTEKMPIKTLRLNRETVKRLAVRTSVRTGAAYNSDGGNSGGVAGTKGGPPKDSSSNLVLNSSDTGFGVAPIGIGIAIGG